MAERRGGLGARLARRLAGLRVRRERKGKRTPEEARSRDRPWGGQSCPDLAQGQGSTSKVSLKAKAQSRSELDLRSGSLGSWLWKRRHSSGGPTEPLGRLQRPAVGSASDLANYASMGQDSLAPAATSGEPAGARGPSGPPPAPGRLEQGPPGHTCRQPPHSARGFPLWPEAPSNLEDVLPHPASCPRAEGAKGEPTSPGPALPEPAQTLHERPSARRTRYYRITVSLQGREQAPGEETEEPKPAQPAPHPCGPEESRGWQEPPQGPRPITGCLADPPQEPQLRAPPHQGSTAQRQELRAGRMPGSPHRRVSLVAQRLENSACNAGDTGLIPALGRSPGEGNGNHSSVLAWETPWTAETGGLQSMCHKETDTTGASEHAHLHPCSKHPSLPPLTLGVGVRVVVVQSFL